MTPEQTYALGAEASAAATAADDKAIVLQLIDDLRSRSKRMEKLENELAAAKEEKERAAAAPAADPSG